MSETGLLGNMFPPSDRSQGGRILAVPALFADEHAQAIDADQKIRLAELTDEHPISAAILEDAPNKAAFYIAILLHQLAGRSKIDEANAEALIEQRGARRQR